MAGASYDACKASATAASCALQNCPGLPTRFPYAMITIILQGIIRIRNGRGFFEFPVAARTGKPDIHPAETDRKREQTMNFFDTLDWGRTVHDYEFTRKARRQIHEVITAESFADMPTEEIFLFLYKGISMVSFKDYLKRYLYERAGIEEPFHQVDDRVWRDIIENSFEENNAPHSFEPTTTRWSATVKNWLSSDRIRRSSVLLLGFGLRMDEEDVETFLTKVLEEDTWHMDDPEEVIFRYCYRRHLPYARALALRRQAEALSGHTKAKGRPDDEEILKDESSLLRYLGSLFGAAKGQEKTEAQRCAEALYDRCRTVIAGIYNRDEEEKPEKERRDWHEEDITPADLEKMLCSGIPVNEAGNLAKANQSLLSRHFQNYRPSRQRLDVILNGKARPDRYDLITLCFFLHAQDEELTGEERLAAFLEEVNPLLRKCGMNEIHPATPYEAFILICILSDCPLAVYGDIWEMAYGEE